MPEKTGHRVPGPLKAAAAVALLVVAAVALGDRLPGFGEVTGALRDADTGWLAVAAVAEFVSLAMFGRQQRRLLTAFGVRMTRRRALALAYSRAAIAISLPAGSALSAAYAFRQFRIGGASRRTAATVMVLSGLLSVGALALLYTTGALAAAAARLTGAWPEVLVMAVLGLLVVAGLLGRRTSRPGPPRRALGGLTARWPRLDRALRPVLDAVDSSRSVPGRHWGLALAAAVTNWLTDLLCLYAAARAFHLPLDLVTLGAVYLTVQIVRQIPLTPGGIGVIELSLLAGLISAGAGEAAAAATVLAYRLLSCWLIIPVGALTGLGLRRPPRRDEPAERPPEVLPGPGRGLGADRIPRQRVLADTTGTPRDRPRSRSSHL